MKETKTKLGGGSSKKPAKPQSGRTCTLAVIIEKDEDGYFVSCPSLQGCYTQGDTLEEAVANIRDAIQLHLEDRLAAGESIPLNEVVGVMTLEVKV